MTEHYTDNRRWSHISNAWILLDSWNDREEIASLKAARSADEALMREAVAQLQIITAAYRKAVKLYDPNTDDAYSVDAHNAIARLRARLEGTTS